MFRVSEPTDGWVAVSATVCGALSFVGIGVSSSTEVDGDLDLTVVMAEVTVCVVLAEGSTVSECVDEVEITVMSRLVCKVSLLVSCDAVLTKTNEDAAALALKSLVSADGSVVSLVESGTLTANPGYVGNGNSYANSTADLVDLC